MIVFLQSRDPKRPTHSPFTDEERVEAHRSIFGAYAGRYTVEGNKVIHHIEASWRPEWIGTEQTRFFEINDKETHAKDTAAYVDRNPRPDGSHARFPKGRIALNAPAKFLLVGRAEEAVE